MSRLETVRENWADITDKLLRDKQLLAHFLRFSTGMYKQSFSDAALIYQQNPYATKVATLEMWNKLGRLVNRGERSIAVFGEGNSAKHLFDISQTNGKRIPDLWKLTEDIADELTAVINKKYGKDCKNIQETIAAMSVDNTRPHLTEMMYATQQLKLTDSELKTYQQSFVSAVRFMVLNRCELDGGMKVSGGINLNAVDLFKDTRDLIRFCDLVQKSAKDTLLEMEREIIQILNQRRERRNDLQSKLDRADVGANPVHGQSRRAEAARTADRQVGEDVAGVDTHGVSDRGSGVRDRGSVADNSEGNRHRGGEPLSGAGRAVQAAEPAPVNVRGNPSVGENAVVERGTSGDGGSRVPNEITVESLIERYNNADFNRRWDSYETAGWILSDAKATEYRLDAMEHFNKFHADKFSVAQAEEIRGLIRAALENRERAQDFIDVTVPDEQEIVDEQKSADEPPVEEEPSEDSDYPDDEDEVIINNSYIETSDLPPLTDEKLIFGILKYDRFFKIKREQIAEFFAENTSSTDRAELMKKAFNHDYTEFDIGKNRGGFKTTDNGVVVWEGHYLNRYKESGLSWDLVQSLTAKMIEQGEYLDERRPLAVTNAEELIDGDTIRIDGEEWKVLHTSDYLISMKNSEGKERNLYNTLDKKWYDLLDEHGFEFISSSDDEHKFFKPEDEIVEPLDEPIDDEPEQLTLFGDYELSEPTNSVQEKSDEDSLEYIPSKNPKTVDELQVGDYVKYEGEIWQITDITGNVSIDLENINKNADEPTMSIWSNWKVAFTNDGFEYLTPRAAVKDTPKKTEPKKSEPKRKAPRKTVAYSNSAPNAEMINYILKCGGNDQKTLERIVAQFQKGKSDAENAVFLRKEFCSGYDEDGRGYSYVSGDFTSSALLAAWFDENGITAAISNTAFPGGEKIHLTWEQVSKKISVLLERGEYCEQDIIDRAVDNELADVAAELWYLHQDFSEEYRNNYFIPFSWNSPEDNAKIKAGLADKNTLQGYINGMDKFLTDYEENNKILRFRFHKPRELMSRLKDLQIQRKEFLTKTDFKFEPKFFISEDEKDWLVKGGGNVQHSKFRIAKFFGEEHSAKEKADFLKHEYGDGGSCRTGYSTNHNSKGLRFRRGSISNPFAEVLMKWNEVAERVDKLISEDRYITQKDIDERIRDAKRTIANEYGRAEDFIIERERKVLEEYGVELDEPAPVPDENSKDEAVFWNAFGENYIAVMQTDEGIDYTVYAPDLTPVDGGVWEMDSAVDLKFAAAQLADVSENELAEISDYNRFFELADADYDFEVANELNKMVAEAVGNMENPVEPKQDEPITEQKTETSKSDRPTVNAPEKIVAAKKEPKSGTPFTYHFNEKDVVTGGAKAKFNANVEAIRTLQKIESENRYATPEEQSILARYVGWGGIPQAFTTDRAAESIGNLGDAAPSGWENEQRELRELLSPDEYAAARESTLTSFYTPPEVTDGVYQALEQFGFEGGNVLEPSMGVGNFFSKMPENIRQNSRLYGVELDSISGRIAQQLYPNERIQVKGFEQTNFNNNSFDVVIGNIPFGDYKVTDKKYDKLNFKIHDYFAAKSVDKVKPGGVVALVTSKFTMYKKNEKARRYLAERCDLLGAVRLPNTAFKQSAGTEVTTDILFLKKRDTLTVEVPDWVYFSETADGVPCNKYFVDNPDMVLGKMAFDERMKGKYGDDSKVTTCLANEDTPLSEQLKATIAKIQGSIDTVRAEEQECDESDIILADPSVRNFTHTIVDGQLYFRENEVMTRVAETGRTLDRMMGMHKIRQAAMALIDAQAVGCSDEELKKLQAELNAVYDKFRKAYGNITDSANERCFRSDDDYNTLAALEIVDSEKKTVEKAEIFSKRTIQPEVVITNVETPQEALQVAIDRIGRVDIEYMARLCNSTPEQVISDLGADIYRNPAKIKEDEPFSGYEDASEYLSGNVREKLKIAREYTEHIDESFQRNVDALEKVIPKDLEASEISVRIGANWIDVEDYNKFLHEYAKADTSAWGGHPVVRTKMGEYKIEGKYQDRSVAANSIYGTPRMSSYHIFENLLNQRDIVVRDRKEEDGKVWYEVNAKETQLAKEKARQMKEGFKSWIWEDIGRREKYVEKYNYLFNAIRGREYDGSYQSFPGMNLAIKLRPHQENAVLRGKLGGNTLLAHCVGAGKSFEMIATTMEKKRLGLINKGCVVVPKHLTLQMASEWMRLYPNAKLLVARPEDFTKDNRQKFIARCVTGDYDAVIMSFTQIERIPMSDQYRKQFMERELNEIMDALEEVDSTDRVSVKALERQKRQLEERLEKLLSSKKDNSLCFEKLGFDYLVCDEAHNYKNCFVATKMSNVAGVQTTAAQKSEDMLMKTQYLNEKYGCNNILYATGTPCSNSMVEFYVMQRYLRPDLLTQAGLQTFDDWASTFGEVVSQLEIKPAGNGFQNKNRFSKFVNIPELMQIYKEFADIQTPDMIKLPVPKLKTGEPIVVSSKPDDWQKAYMKELAARSEAIHNGNVDPSVDNMLKITHEARLLGLDSRCIFKDAEPAPDSKVMKLLDNLEQNYRDTMEQKGVQIVFCDIAINEDAEHFSIYEAIKNDLVKRGIPRDEICFAGDAKTDKARAEMFEQLRKGEKRFILASTSKLGTGANIQDRICAIHHLDIPWKPSDLTQQDGRGIRQGNMFDEVGIYHYLTEETFDAYMMGIITNKAKFINQIMTSKDPVRVSEDVDEMVLTYSQMQAIASGNPMIKEKIQLDNDIAMLKTLEAEHKKSVFKMQELAERRLPQTIDNYADLLQKASADLKAFQEQHPDNAEFKIEIGGKTVDERTDAGKEIENAIIKCSANGETVAIGKYFGFGVTIEKNPANTSFISTGTPCVAVLHGKLNYTCEVSLGNDVGNVRRIENLAGNQINQKIQQLSASLDKAKNDLEEAKASMAKPFERAEELANMQARLEFVNAELSKTQVDDEPIIVEPSEESKDDDLDIADKINPLPKNIPPKNDGADEPPHKFRR